MDTAAKVLVSAGEYLKAERQQDEKFEFFNGKIIPMGGASFNHNRIVRNLVFLLCNATIDRDYEVFSSDLRVHNPLTNSFLYPDVVVVKGKLKYLDDAFDTLTNPHLIIEVTSSSTIEKDKGEKFAAYRKTKGFREYVLISQDNTSVETFYKDENDKWEIEDYRSPEDKLLLKSIGLTLTLSDIYKKVV